MVKSSALNGDGWINMPMTSVFTPATMMLYPSVGDCTNRAAASMPLPPGRLTIEKLWPRSLARYGSIARLRLSR